jgi:hypothetical protein
MISRYQSSQDINLNLESSVFSPEDIGKQGPIQVRKKADSGKLYFKVYLFITGQDLPFVDKIVYKLHPTFKKNMVTSKPHSGNSYGSISIWTWGLFELTAEVKLRNGKEFTLKHQLNYDKELKEHKSKIKVQEF